MRPRIPGQRLKSWLDQADLSQAQLANRMNVDPGQVSRWCRDKASLSGAQAAAVVDIIRSRGVAVELPQPAHRVFLATPMASLDESSYETDRAEAVSVYRQLDTIAAPVYWPAAQIGSARQFEAPDLATERNVNALADAEAFVYLQLRELIQPTSCHVELGMAVAWEIPVTVFAPSETSLPYMLRHFEAISGRSGIGGRFRFHAINDAAGAVRLLNIHGTDLLGITPGRRLERSR
jgi:transcriptional regulator with XRE-family HTH domain